MLLEMPQNTGRLSNKDCPPQLSVVAEVKKLCKNQGRAALLAGLQNLASSRELVTELQNT